jgi:hypothetical protein
MSWLSGFDKRRTTLWLVALAAVCAAWLLASTAAHAATYRVDRFSITDNHFDFGDGSLNNISGRPNDDGRLDWNLVAGKWEPRVLGRIYVNNASGDCVRLRMVVGLTTGAATYTDNFSDFCAPNGQTWYHEVDYAPISSANVIWVQVQLQSASSAAGAWVTEGSSLLYFHP